MPDTIKTNLSENELYLSYLKILQKCCDCRIIHKSCGVKSPCHKCGEFFWVIKLSEHFGVEHPFSLIDN